MSVLDSRLCSKGENTHEEDVLCCSYQIRIRTYETAYEGSGLYNEYDDTIIKVC